MLRKRSSPLSSPRANHHQQRRQPKIPSPFLSPRHLLVGLSSKGGFFPVESTMSPTSVLDTNNSSPINNPFFPFSDMLSSPRKSKPASEFDTRPIGLGLVDVLDSDKLDKMVLIGSKLRTKAPCANPMPISRSGSIEFGIKNRESQLALFSPKWTSPLAIERQSSRVMSVDEMEMSEDYTCVIAHGPNPRKTHIFDNCVVGRCGDAFWERPRDEGISNGGGDFLRFCETCKRSLGEGRDIFMYRGEKGFCSVECREQAIQFDEATDKPEI